MPNLGRQVLLLTLPYLLAACGENRSSQTMAVDLYDRAGCYSFENDLWASLKRVAKAEDSLPTPRSLHASIESQGRLRGWREDRVQEFAHALREFHNTLIKGVERYYQPGSGSDWEKALDQVQRRDSSRPELAVFQMNLQGRLDALRLVTQQWPANCARNRNFAFALLEINRLQKQNYCSSL